MWKVKSHVVGLGLDGQPSEYLDQLFLDNVLSTTNHWLIRLVPSFLEKTQTMLDLEDGGLVISCKRLEARKEDDGYQNSAMRSGLLVLDCLAQPGDCLGVLLQCKVVMCRRRILLVVNIARRSWW